MHFVRFSYDILFTVFNDDIYRRVVSIDYLIAAAIYLNGRVNKNKWTSLDNASNSFLSSRIARVDRREGNK